MQVSYPVNEAEFNSQFTDNYKDVPQRLGRAACPLTTCARGSTAFMRFRQPFVHHGFAATHTAVTPDIATHTAITPKIATHTAVTPLAPHVLLRRRRLVCRG